MNKISGAVSIGRTHARDDHINSIHASKEAKTGVVNSSQERDDLVLTSAAKQIFSVKSAQQSVLDIDQAKVDQIKLAIRNDSYQVSAQRIANKLVEMEKL